jgi:malto-oligosyltrehalose trehalohydrolase
MRRYRRLPFGAERSEAGTRFRLWAPRARFVSVILDGGAVLPMQAEGEGWFVLATGRAGPGTRYRYLVDGRAYPDPASRWQPEGVHGASEIVDPQAYLWSDSDWHGRAWEEIVLYELHLGAFSESGDYAGAAGHLDHLCALGVTAVELMPVAAYGGRRNWGYDGAFLYAPAACYGRPDGLKGLVEACHRRGLAVFLDVVYNHLGPEGNWLATIAPDFFAGRHTPWGPAIDFSLRPVRDFVIENALYWLEEYHFDGLRLDAADAMEDASSPDILTELAATVASRLPDRRIHLVLENDRNESRRLAPQGGYRAQWNDDLHHTLHHLLTGEGWGVYRDYRDRPLLRLGTALAEGFAYQGEVSTHRGGRRRGEASAGLPPTAFIGFLQNHDQVGNDPCGMRLVAKTSEAALHAALAILLLSPQIPLLFMGEEWASASPFFFFCDFPAGLAAAVRRGRHAGFTRFPELAEAGALDRMPDPNQPETFAACRLDWSETARPPHTAWLERYRRLLAIRTAEIVPRLAGMAGGAGMWRPLGERGIAVEWRLGDGAQLQLFANFSAVDHPIAPPPNARLLYRSDTESPSVSLAPASAAGFLAPP